MSSFEATGKIKELLKSVVVIPCKDKNFECTICNTWFSQKQTLKQHVLTHTGQRPYRCSVCEKSFTQKGSLDRHYRLHDDHPKPFSCHLCPLAFRQLNNLKRHVLLHDSTPAHQCDICFRRFARKEGLLRHAKTHLSKPEKLHCHYCGKAFADPESVIRHVKWVHCTMSSSCACSLCEKRPQDHIDRVNQATHKCKLCSDRFVKEANLKKHYLCHRHEVRDLNEYVKVYQCHFCKQLFTSRPRIIRHVRKHEEPSQPKIIEIVGESVLNEEIEEKRLSNTSLKVENISGRSGAQVQEKPLPLLLPKALKTLLTLICVNPNKCCDQITQPKEDVMIETNCDYNVKSEREVFDQLPPESDDRDSNINIVYDNNEPVAILYKDNVIEEKKPREDEITKEKEINETSAKLEEEVFSDVGYDKDPILDDLEEEIYIESLINGETTRCDDTIELQYPDQMLTDELSREIKLEEHHFEEYDKDQEPNDKEEIHNYDGVETSSFLLEERTTSAPNSPRMIDDLDFSFDSESQTHDEIVAKIPNLKSLQISLETIKCLVRHSSDVSSNKSMPKIANGSVPLGASLSSSSQDSPDTAEVEYVKVLPDEDLAYNNMTLHKEGKHYFCYICKKTYTSKNSLKRHFRVAHMTYEKEQCSLCSKMFQTADALRKHVRALHAPHRFLCSVCERTFSRKDALASHQRLHSGDKPYACPVCGESFAQKQNLHYHSKKHLKEKPFSCDVCGKGFAAKTSMRRHILVHTGERKFRCHVCDKAFQQKVHLDNHLTIHGIIDDSKIFECRQCGRVFHRKETLRRHVATHAQVKLHSDSHRQAKSHLPVMLTKPRCFFYCHHCKMSFTKKLDLRRHFYETACKDEMTKNNRSLFILPD